jgi:protein-tyrosine phosphatase
VAGLAADGVKTGVYCQAGIFRTTTVAIAYLIIRGRSLDAASRLVRVVRPQAMSALEPWRSLDTSKAS